MADNRRLAKMLGAMIRKARRAQGLNLQQLSRLSGIGIATLSHLENGNRDVKLSTIERAFDALHLTLPGGPPDNSGADTGHG